MPKKMILSLMIALLLGITSCVPIMATRGNYLEDDRLKGIQMNVSSKGEVQQKLGSPTVIDPFSPNRWMYVGEKTSTTAFFEPKVESRKIFIMTFDDSGILRSAEEVDETAAQQIETVKNTTPSPGKEMNAFEQFLSNLGKFNQMPGGDRPTQGR